MIVSSIKFEIDQSEFIFKTQFLNKKRIELEKISTVLFQISDTS